MRNYHPEIDYLNKQASRPLLEKLLEDMICT